MKTILEFIRPKENCIYAMHDISGLKLITRLRLNFGHLNQYNLRHKCTDTINPLPICGFELETTDCYLLCCKLHTWELGLDLGLDNLFKRYIYIYTYILYILYMCIYYIIYICIIYTYIHILYILYIFYTYKYIFIYIYIYMYVCMICILLYEVQLNF